MESICVNCQKWNTKYRMKKEFCLCEYLTDQNVMWLGKLSDIYTPSWFGCNFFEKFKKKA